MIKNLFIVLFLNCLIMPVLFADGWDPNTQASNVQSMINTRHNLTALYSDMESLMDLARSDYVEVCVYCHTPHGSNTQIEAPIWNRTINTGLYQVYDAPRTLNQPITQPGPNSLTCLSCHDGTIAIDSIINMPGSGLYLKSQETSVNPAFLDAWPGAGVDGNHFTMGPEPSGTNCTFCHNPDQFIGAPDYTVFVIGTDLTNDHPIGVLYPESFGPGIDFVQPTGEVPGKMKYFDTNQNNYPDKSEIRLYDTGTGAEVECASCHDPHGVPSAGQGSPFIASFLRVNNGLDSSGSVGSSALCLTCHNK